MSALTAASLCSGYLGLDLAVESVLGTQLVWYSEIEPAPASVGAARFPGVPNLGDLTKVNWRMLVGRRRDDVTALAMYERYKAGLSLAEVAAEFAVSRQTVYKRFERRGWPMRTAVPRPAVLFNGFKYTLRDNGYFARTTNERLYLHRDMWEHHYGPIAPDHDIHHQDHDRTHNVIENLEMLPKPEHARLHGTGCNQFVHRCNECRGVMPLDSHPVEVDVLTAGYPSSVSTVLARGPAQGSRR